MKIEIISVGKIKEKYLQAGIDEFSKRIRPYSSINVIEIPQEDLTTYDVEEKARLVESNKIEKVLTDYSYKIALDIKGKKLSSEKLAQKIKEVTLDGTSHIVFIIGGSTGLHQNILDQCHFRLSFSDMTFPHQLMRLILLEQVYRAFKIIKGEPYHK